MSLSDATPQNLAPIDVLDATTARDLTEQIKVGVEAVWHLVAKAYQGRAWIALGYASWDDYCTREFGTARLRLPREDRQEVVASLRESGLSTRAIASATGQSVGQTHADLASVQNRTLGPVTGVNGKQYQPVRPQSDDPITLGDDDITDSDCVSQPLDEDDVWNTGLAPEWSPSKPDLGGGVSHPARYSHRLIDLFRKILAEEGIPGDSILDPFAGTGRIHNLQADGWHTAGIELEPEWADLHPDNLVGSALHLPFGPETFGAIVTSPTYGNRLADSHNASDPERRRSYTHDLGRDLHKDNSGTLHWRNGSAGSEDYRAFHEKAWDEAVLVLQPGGLFILNFCDHIRGHLVQPVTAWHTWYLGHLGLDYVNQYTVPTPKLRQGENASLREQEYVFVFRKPI